MRRYETIIISDPDLSDKDREQLFAKVTNLMPKEGGFLVLVDEWGAKKLAYEVKKKSRGFYVRFDYCGKGNLVNEIERFCRINDNVLKYMTVLLDDDVDVEAIHEEIKNREAEAEKAAEEQKEKLKKAEQDAAARDEQKPDDAPDQAPADNEADKTETDEKE